jgi:hypothetical protein
MIQHAILPVGFADISPSMKRASPKVPLFWGSGRGKSVELALSDERGSQRLKWEIGCARMRDFFSGLFPK